MTEREFSRDSHYVPQIYLRQWAYDGKRIWTNRLLVANEKIMGDVRAESA